MTTVVIPAHNEGRVIGRLLAQILCTETAGELNVLVVANGCTDDTVDVAASFGPGVRVISLPAASKYQALLAGYREAGDYPRIYLDADVEVRAQDVQALAAALCQPGVLAAGPERVLALAGRPWPVRWYYDVWSRLPAVGRELWGRGVIAVNEAGQQRLAGLPQLLGDDLAASLVFASHERTIVPGAQVIVHTPWTLGDLLRRRIRAAMARAQIEQAEQVPQRMDQTRMSDLAAIVRSEPSMTPRVALFLALTVIARVAARRVVARGDFTTWLRDESSRGEAT